jgi:hypothetical protein
VSVAVVASAAAFAVVLHDSLSSVADNCCDLQHPSFLVDVESESFDFDCLTIAASDFAEVVATLFDFGASAFHIDYALGCSNLTAGGAADPDSCFVVERGEKLRLSTKEKYIWFS